MISILLTICIIYLIFIKTNWSEIYMSILFSRQCEYALQAVSYLSLKPKNQMTSIKELNKKLKIPYHFLGKILQNLAHKGLLKSQKGPLGGFALAISANEITLFHIVEAIDGTDLMERCVMGFSDCSGKGDCALHSKWGKIRQNIYYMLTSASIGETAKKMKKSAFINNK